MSSLKYLLHIENQFAAIKPLVSEAQALVADSHVPYRLSRNYFREWEQLWRIWQQDQTLRVKQIYATENERRFVLETLLWSLKLLVEVKRMAESSNRRQRIAKSDLMLLLGELNEQAMAEVVLPLLPLVTSYPDDALPKKRSRRDATYWKWELKAELKACALSVDVQAVLGQLAMGMYLMGDWEGKNAERFRKQYHFHRKKEGKWRTGAHVKKAHNLLRTMYSLQLQTDRLFSDRIGVAARELAKRITRFQNIALV
jgi:hypothetical protein